MRACLFDLDGVLTSTASVHAAAWKEAFDEFLHEHDASAAPFDIDRDYPAYVDGKPRRDGVRDFLASRGIELPEGADDDAPDAHTVSGIGNRKQGLLLEVVKRDGVQPYPGAVRFLEAARDAGLRRAVVSSSENCQAFVEAAGIEDLLEVRVDGVSVREQGLHGKPAPDTFLAAAQELGVPAAQAAVFEDALAGVEAGRAGHFGFVVGVDRAHQADALKEHGASVVVNDIGDLL
ncbi:beta-phosphoglucomutase family hydrolase [Nocardioides anomalus]|uniref:Beta-phosphoglucomutase n=1 Tax=Nocardioides anomalus TaxID=2712223 RepID=A0A6G6WLX4_9ACTN|nr:beta-phosphoglucomutase family hydrolase [Nocardioides anomalus]